MTEMPGHAAIVFRPPGPRPVIAEVHFTGNDVLPATLLINELAAVAVGAPYSETGLRQMLDGSVRTLYEARGRVAVAFPKVAVEKSAKVDGVVVTVTVDEGPSYNLGSVRIAGVSKSDADALQRTANWKTGDIANLDEVNAGVNKILRKLKNNGFLRAGSHMDRAVHDKEHTIDLVVTLEPGPQFLFGKLEIQGLDLLTEPPIRKAWAIQSGKPFNPDYPDAFLKGLKDDGIFENPVETRAETSIHEAARTVDVTLFFKAKPKTDAKKIP